MVSEDYKAMLQGKSIIRQLAEYATARGAEIGYENVFDYSLGNPGVPAPQAFTDEMIRLLKEEDPMKLHGYSQSQGIPEVRQKHADYLNKRFGMNYTAEHLFMTTGAAGAVAHAARAVTKPGDEVITFAPFFPEYIQYINRTGAKLKIVQADTENFQIDFDAFRSAFTDKTAAVLINTPNNPSGAMYSEETLKTLSGIMRKMQDKYDHEIFLLSDEPYREIVFDGKTCPYPAKFYENTLTCYSYSKSLSVPGERIGYVAINPEAKDADLISAMCAQISRGLGHNCPPSIIQLAVANTLGVTSDISVYETNMNTLYDELTGLGFKIVRPGGTFYIMPKALEDDSVSFCNKAKEHDLILVPADGFGAPGYFRMAYCIETEKVNRSLEAFRRFVNECYPGRRD
ncbi:MAG: pyridoxal phosphate-dependent aminotransferase [Lachnospiraceae bacterium]|nr:pyridoxal phosphate-dependent aminotransferase [Lachnospiraceae bacterium]